MSPPFSSFHAASFMLVSSLAYSPTLKMEAAYSSGTSVDFVGLHDIISQKIKFSITSL
jgi:hypothetical protein